MAHGVIKYKRHVHILYRMWEVSSISALLLLFLSSSEHLIFPFTSLTFPVVSFLFLGVFVFLSFFIRSAGGAKYSGGKGICPIHTKAPNCKMTTQTHMHTGRGKTDTHKKHTQKNEKCKDSEAIFRIKQKNKERDKTNVWIKGQNNQIKLHK